MNGLWWGCSRSPGPGGGGGTLPALPPALAGASTRPSAEWLPSGPLRRRAPTAAHRAGLAGIEAGRSHLIAGAHRFGPKRCRRVFFPPVHRPAPTAPPTRRPSTSRAPPRVGVRPHAQGRSRSTTSPEPRAGPLLRDRRCPRGPSFRAPSSAAASASRSRTRRHPKLARARPAMPARPPIVSVRHALPSRSYLLGRARRARALLRTVGPSSSTRSTPVPRPARTSAAAATLPPPHPRRLEALARQPPPQRIRASRATPQRPNRDVGPPFLVAVASSLRIVALAPASRLIRRKDLAPLVLPEASSRRFTLGRADARTVPRRHRRPVSRITTHTRVRSHSAPRRAGLAAPARRAARARGPSRARTEPSRKGGATA